jgi:hypothetical protein
MMKRYKEYLQFGFSVLISKKKNEQSIRGLYVNVMIFPWSNIIQHLAFNVEKAECFKRYKEIAAIFN